MDHEQTDQPKGSNIFDAEADRANEKINEEFYENKRNLAGVSPALLLNTAPIVDTDDLYYLDQNEER
jgi:hypothetical protein